MLTHRPVTHMSPSDLKIEIMNSHEDTESNAYPAGYVQAFARGLDVIKSFSEKTPIQTLSEVAKQTSMTRAGARRILITLKELGYVAVDGRNFKLTPKILDLGFSYLSSMPIWNLAEPIVESLTEQVNESSSIAVLDGDEVIYVMRVSTRKIMKNSLAIGSRLPAFWTSLGRILLANKDDKSLEQMLNQTETLPAYTRHTITDKAVLLETIRQTRLQGWSMVNQELEEGLLSIAAPIYSRNGQASAAINISGQANRNSLEQMKFEFLPKLLEASKSITELIKERGAYA